MGVTPAPDALRKECEQLAKQLWHSEACEPLQLVDALLRFAKQQQARVWREAEKVVADDYRRGRSMQDAVWRLHRHVIRCDSTARELEKL